jgi:hypothetical protein
MPATDSTLWALQSLKTIASKAYEPLPDPVKMSQHYRSVKNRLTTKNKLGVTREAKDKGVYAYTKHFGNWDSGVTYERLLTHHERGGQFPPSRQELNDLLLEF